MKLLRVFSVLAIFILLATSTLPVMAQDEGPKDPNVEIRVETFEVVRNLSTKEYKNLHPADSPNAALAAAGCKSYTLGRKGYALPFNTHVWTYSWTIDWCYNGSTITSVHKAGPQVWTNWGTMFMGNIEDSDFGGVGQTFYRHYGQGEFCDYFDVGDICVNWSYPWTNQTVRGNGTYSGTAGND